MAGRQTATVRRDGSFDAFATALRGLALSGSIEAAELSRVADQIADGAATVAWKITGTTDALGRPALVVSLDGSVTLECQRCLRNFAWPVAQQTLLLLARDEREQAHLDEDDEHEVVVAAAPLDPRVLVEDELLLTLPFAPHCERGDCTLGGPQPEGEVPPTPGREGKAFEALAPLKSRRTPKSER